MDLSTTWMGLQLQNPLIAGASPLSDDLDACRRAEDAGAAALVMHSLFMEQLLREQSVLQDIESFSHSSAEASSYVALPTRFALGPEEYLEQLARLKAALRIPVIGSLNGTTTGRWTRHARLIEEAGADGLELNVYYLPLDGSESGEDVERRYLEILAAVKEQVRIPVAMKLTYFFTAPVHFAKRLDAAGVDGIVMFNRLYEPEMDVEELCVRPSRPLSKAGSLKQRVLWVAATFGRVRCPLAVSGGVHTAHEAVQSIMAGAAAAQMTSALLIHGPAHIGTVRAGLGRWMEEHGYQSVRQMQGCLSLLRSPDPEALERANYLRSLNTWVPGR